MKLRCKLCKEVILSTEMLQTGMSLSLMKPLFKEIFTKLELKDASQEFRKELSWGVTLGIVIKHIQDKHPDLAKTILDNFEVEADL